MVILLVLILSVLLVYLGYIGALIVGFYRLKTFEYKPETALTTFSILVPFRNEADNLPNLLNSFARLDYPKELLEFIFINDESSDESVNCINRWRMQNGLFQTTLLDNLRRSASPKKDAISRAVPIVKGQWILTTDADCVVNTNWLSSFNAYILSNNVQMVAGPVAFSCRQNFLNHFQKLDFLSLQGATIGSFGIQSPFMCNGANFAYTKELFLRLGGFKGNDGIASGDDVFLLQQAVAEKPGSVHFLKCRDAIVITKPTESWRELVHQRCRWAAKSTSYTSAFAQDLGLVVLLANLLMLVCFGMTAAGFLDWRLLIGLFLIKFIPDWILIWQSGKFFKSPQRYFPFLSAVLYPIFVSFIGVFALFGSYDWKGRRYKK